MQSSFANPIQQSHNLHSDLYNEIAKLPIDLFFKEELSCEESSRVNLFLPREEFHFLNTSTYFSLYPDLFAEGVMHDLNFVELHSALLQPCEVQSNHDLHLENKEDHPFSRETFYQLSTWELGDSQTSGFKEVSHDSLKCLSKQYYSNRDHVLEIEDHYEISSADGLHHNTNNVYTTSDDSSPILFNPVSLFQDDNYEHFNPY